MGPLKKDRLVTAKLRAEIAMTARTVAKLQTDQHVCWDAVGHLRKLKEKLIITETARARRYAMTSSPDSSPVWSIDFRAQVASKSSRRPMGKWAE